MLMMKPTTRLRMSTGTARYSGVWMPLLATSRKVSSATAIL